RLLAADVLLAPDLRHRQPRLLQRLEAGVDHVRVAAQVGDVARGVGRELRQELLHVAVAHVDVRMRRSRLRQLAREAGDEAEAGVALRERAELVAVQQLVRRARAEQQHHLDAAPRDRLLQQRQHRAVRGDAGAGADQQVAAVGVIGHQAEASERPAGLHRAAFLQPFEQRRRRAAGNVAHRDLDRVARTQRMVVDGGQRIRALGRRAVGVLEMHLYELAGDEVQRLPVAAAEGQVRNRRREHAPAGELERKLDDGQGCVGRSGPGVGRWGAYTSPSPQNAAKAPDRMTPVPHPAPGAPALRIRDLRKTYDTGVQALRGVSLDVEPGDFYALLGPNGAGKSTLIGIVSSLVNMSAGEVSVFGIDLATRRGDAMHRIGLVPQEVNFNMFEKPLDILVNYAGFYGVPRAQAIERAN